MRETESSLPQFGEFLLKRELVRQSAAPYVVRWVRQFLSRQASDEPLADQVRHCCDDLERAGRFEDWQVRQADQALRIYFVNFLDRTDWHRRPASTIVDEKGRTMPLAAPETAALLAALRGLPQVMAGVIYGGGLRVSECCELRVKDIDFDQGLVFVRSGKGNKDRSTLLTEVGREELRAHLRESEAQYQADRQAGLAGVWMPDALDDQRSERRVGALDEPGEIEVSTFLDPRHGSPTDAALCGGATLQQ